MGGSMKIVKAARSQHIIEHFDLFFEPGTYTKDHLQFDKIIFYDIAGIVDLPVSDINKLDVFYDKENEVRRISPCRVILKGGNIIYINCIRIEGIIYQQHTLDNEKLEAVFKEIPLHIGKIYKPTLCYSNLFITDENANNIRIDTTNLVYIDVLSRHYDCGVEYFHIKAVYPGRKIGYNAHRLYTI